MKILQKKENYFRIDFSFISLRGVLIDGATKVFVWIDGIIIDDGNNKLLTYIDCRKFNITTQLEPIFCKNVESSTINYSRKLNSLYMSFQSTVAWKSFSLLMLIDHQMWETTTVMS